MKKLARIGILISWLLLTAAAADAQCTVPTPTPNPARQRVIDARPNRVFAATGQTRFGNKGTVVIKNMNPFLFEGYRISIQEEEIKDEAVVKFLKALIPVAGPFAESARQEAAFAGEQAPNFVDNHLEELVSRLSALPTSAAHPTGPHGCAATDAPCLAVARMIVLKNQLETTEQELRYFFTDTSSPPGTYAPAPGGIYPPTSYMLTTNFAATKTRFIDDGAIIFNRDTETPTLCTTVTNLLPILNAANAYPSKATVTEQQRKIDNMAAKARALKQAVDLYNGQDALKNTKWIGSTGFDYVADLDLLARELFGAVNSKYKEKAAALFNQIVQFDNMKDSIRNLNGKEDTLLQQKFDIGGKYDFSKVTITVQPFGEKTPQDPTGRNEAARNGDAPAGNAPAGRDPQAPGQGGPLTSPPNTGTGGGGGEAAPLRGSLGFAEAGGAGGGGNNQPAANPAPAGGPSKTTDVVTTGRPRFEIGIGMAYAPVERRQFQIVSGFARDREGNLANGETFTKVVGFSERTDHRLSPIALLHTRLTSNPRRNLYFSLGITGSRDELGTNIEYLIGPSVNLSDNVFVTVGAFAARQQSLAGEDVFVGAAVPSGFESIPVRSRYRWKPGLSFSYRLPLKASGKKKETAAAEAAGGSLEAYTDTLFAGQPRFSISAGMAYSSLRRQSFQPIIGFARDRDGGLTNGETLTKVLGFNEDSGGRLLPMALLNTRVRSNEDFGLHFSLGITAKRTDAKTDVEYLIGPSLSFMKNQILITAGAYAGKQEKIAGDLFVNAPLSSGISITTEREYRFKPGVAFSYRLPVKLP